MQNVYKTWNVSEKRVFNLKLKYDSNNENNKNIIYLSNTHTLSLSFLIH